MNLQAGWMPWVVTAMLVVGCNSAVGMPSPAASSSLLGPSPRATVEATPVPSPSPRSGTGEVTSPAQAAALVFASNPLFASMGPLEPDMVGQAAWYEASDQGDGYSVVVTMGSGDCFAGCIDRHTWNYVVERDGTVSLASQDGDDVEVTAPDRNHRPATVSVRLMAGPVCAVEQRLADRNCAPRTVSNAEVVLRDPSGAEVARGVSSRDGTVAFSVPGGAYYVEPAAVDGFMGQPQPVAFAVVGGSSVRVTATYDTGVR
jgi:hypothetical protein